MANLFISKNGGEWTEWDYSAVSLADGEKLEVYGTEFRNIDYNGYYAFDLTGKIKISGDLVALNNGKIYMTRYNYCYIFKEAKGLIDASDLIFSNNTAERCYESMF